MSEMRIDSSSGPNPGSGAAAGADDGRASQVADDNQVRYFPGDHRFEITLGGKPTTISPLEAVCYVLQNRYVTMSDAVAVRTQEMQDQVNEINESNDWLNAIKKAQDGGSLQKPGDASTALRQWMQKNHIDVRHPDSDDLKKLETEFSNRVDQLSSTNDLKMLQLKTAVNKTQEALTGADAIRVDLKELIQTIQNDMKR